jgi:hypothetical protein
MILDNVRDEFLALASILGDDFAPPRNTTRARRHRDRMLAAIYRECVNTGVTMHPRVRERIYATLRDEVCALWRDTPPWLRINVAGWMHAATQGMQRGWQINDDNRTLQLMTGVRRKKAAS